MRFSWDPEKASINFSKHGVTFEEARTVFGDFLSVTSPDPDRSREESRWITFGESTSRRILAISHTERGNTIRIISARVATRSERRLYEEG